MLIKNNCQGYGHNAQTCNCISTTSELDIETKVSQINECLLISKKTAHMSKSLYNVLFISLDYWGRLEVTLPFDYYT